MSAGILVLPYWAYSRPLIPIRLLGVLGTCHPLWRGVVKGELEVSYPHPEAHVTSPLPAYESSQVDTQPMSAYAKLQ